MIVDVSNVAGGRLEGASILVSICRFAALSDWVSAKVQALLKPPYCTSYVTAPVEASFPGICPAWCSRMFCVGCQSRGLISLVAQGWRWVASTPGWAKWVKHLSFLKEGFPNYALIHQFWSFWAPGSTHLLSLCICIKRPSNPQQKRKLICITVATLQILGHTILPSVSRLARTICTRLVGHAQVWSQTWIRLAHSAQFWGQALERFFGTWEMCRKDGTIYGSIRYIVNPRIRIVWKHVINTPRLFIQLGGQSIF